MLDLIYRFQSMLYELLKSNDFLKSNIKHIFFSIQQDAEYPYLLINEFKTVSTALHAKNQYNIEFNINIFSRDNNLNNLIKIGENIVLITKADSFKSNNFVIVSLSVSKFEITQGHDLLTTKLVISYKLIIR